MATVLVVSLLLAVLGVLQRLGLLDQSMKELARLGTVPEEVEGLTRAVRALPPPREPDLSQVLQRLDTVGGRSKELSADLARLESILQGLPSLDPIDERTKGHVLRVVGYVDALARLVVERTPEPAAARLPAWRAWVAEAEGPSDKCTRALEVLSRFPGDGVTAEALLDALPLAVRDASPAEAVQTTTRAQRAWDSHLAALEPGLRAERTERRAALEKVQKQCEERHLKEQRKLVQDAKALLAPNQPVAAVRGELDECLRKLDRAAVRRDQKLLEQVEELGRRLQARSASEEEGKAKRYAQRVVDDAQKALKHLDEEGRWFGSLRVEQLVQLLGGVEPGSLPPAAAAYWSCAHRQAFEKLNNDDKVAFTKQMLACKRRSLEDA